MTILGGAGRLKPQPVSGDNLPNEEPIQLPEPYLSRLQALWPDIQRHLRKIKPLHTLYCTGRTDTPVHLMNVLAASPSKDQLQRDQNVIQLAVMQTHAEFLLLCIPRLARERKPRIEGYMWTIEVPEFTAILRAPPINTMNPFKQPWILYPYKPEVPSAPAAAVDQPDEVDGKHVLRLHLTHTTNTVKEASSRTEMLEFLASDQVPAADGKTSLLDLLLPDGTTVMGRAIDEWRETWAVPA